MEWPQWTWLALNGLTVGMIIFLHGVPRTGKYNGFAAIIAFFLSYFILWAGGFYPWP